MFIQFLQAEMLAEEKHTDPFFCKKRKNPSGCVGPSLLSFETARRFLE